jgi:hypothetical protein
MYTETENVITNYQANGSVKSDCVDITFTNTSIFSIVTINSSFILLPGQFISITGNKDELNKTHYYWSFTTPGGVIGLNVVRRVYKRDAELKKKFYNTFLNYNKNGFVDSNCADITFGSGFNTFTINGSIQLLAFRFRAFTVNELEVDRTRYYFSVELPSFADINLSVIKKIYL